MRGDHLEMWPDVAVGFVTAETAIVSAPEKFR